VRLLDVHHRMRIVCSFSFRNMEHVCVVVTRTSGKGFPWMIVDQVLLARPRATMPDPVRVKEPITTLFLMASSSRVRKGIFNPKRPDVHKRESEEEMTCIDRPQCVLQHVQ
jgi:hypothetical protein